MWRRDRAAARASAPSSATVAWRIIKMNFLAQLEYRTEFLLQVGVGILWQTSAIVFAVVLLGRFPGMSGWRQTAVFLIVGMRMLSHGLVVLLFGRVYDLTFQVQEGMVDAYLLRPLPVYRQVQLAYFPTNALGDLAVGISIFAAAVWRAPVIWSPGAICFLASAVLGGMLMEAAIVTAISSAALHYPAAHQWSVWIMEATSTFGNYPLTILPRLVQGIFTFLLPIAFIAYFPASLLTGNVPGHGAAHSAVTIAAALSPTVGIMAYLGSRALWNRSLHHYAGVNA